VITEYELYADERMERIGGVDYLTLGGVICTDAGRDRLRAALAELRIHHNLVGAEVRWAKTSKRHIDAYKAWLDVFFDDPHARYSLLSVNRTSPDWQTFRAQLNRPPNDDELLALRNESGLEQLSGENVYEDR
jgi:hypothetical protein